MDSHRVELPIPDSADLVGDGEAFARRVAAGLMGAMQESFGAVEVQGERVTWQAEGWQDDGTFVVLGIDPVERRIQLLLSTRGLEKLGSEPRWVWPLIGLVLAASVAFGVCRHSFWLGVLALVLSFGTWFAIEVALQIAAERRRRIDPALWRQRLEASVHAALRSAGEA